MIITSQNKNPMINFTKYGLNHQKPQNIAKSENIPSMHEKMHVNQKINEKERVQWTYRLMERKTLQKDWLKMKKKISVEPCQVGEKEESLKKQFEQVKSEFLKNLIHEFQLIENQFRSIETDKGLLKHFKKNSIDRKIEWINRNWQRLTKFEEKYSF